MKFSHAAFVVVLSSVRSMEPIQQSQSFPDLFFLHGERTNHYGIPAFLLPP
jgi:hypothetical protein